MSHISAGYAQGSDPIFKVLTAIASIFLTDTAPLYLGQTGLRIYGSSAGDFLNIINDKPGGSIFITPDTGGLNIGSPVGNTTISGISINFISTFPIEFDSSVSIITDSSNAFTVNDSLIVAAHLIVDTTYSPQPNIWLGASIGDAVGFFGSTPIVQPTPAGVTTAGYTANSSLNNVYAQSTFTGNSGSTAYTISDIVRALKDLGLLAL